MSDLVLSPTLTQKSVAIRNSLAGLGSVIELRPETRALVENGLRVQTLLDAIAPDLEIAEVLTIDSPDMLAEAETLNGRISALCADSGAIESERKALNAPFVDLGRAINGGYNELREHVSGVRERLSSKILAYHREQQRLAREREAQERAERERRAAEVAEEERKAKAAAQATLAAAQAAADAGKADEASALATQASVTIDTARQVTQQATLELAAPIFAAPAAKAKGVREVWKAELASHENLILHIAERIKAGDMSLMHLIPYDEAAGNRKAASEKRGFNVPGLRATCDSALSVRKTAIAA